MNKKKAKQIREFAAIMMQGKTDEEAKTTYRKMKKAYTQMPKKKKPQ